MSEQSQAPTMTPTEYHWCGVYVELTERYQKLDPVKAQPVMLVRLLTIRYGFSPVMEALVRHGTAVVAEQARQELTIRQEFIARMMATYPPDDPAEFEEVARDMATELAAIDCPQGGLNLLRYLDRLREREIAMSNRSSMVH